MNRSFSTEFVYQLFSDLSSEGDLYYLGAAADLFVVTPCSLW